LLNLYGYFGKPFTWQQSRLFSVSFISLINEIIPGPHIPTFPTFELPFFIGKFTHIPSGFYIHDLILHHFFYAEEALFELELIGLL